MSIQLRIERELLAKSTSWYQNNCTESHSTAIFHSANICIECHEPSFKISVHSLPLFTITTRSSKEMDFLKIHYENLLYYLFPFKQKTPQNIFGLSHNHHNGHLNQHIIHKTISFTFGRYWDDVQCSFKERFRCERFGDGRSVCVCAVSSKLKLNQTISDEEPTPQTTIFNSPRRHVIILMLALYLTITEGK